MTIVEIAPAFVRISLLGPDTINVYLLEDALIDSGARFAILRSSRIDQGHSLLILL